MDNRDQQTQNLRIWKILLHLFDPQAKHEYGIAPFRVQF